MFGLLALTAVASGMFLVVARRRRRDDEDDGAGLEVQPEPEPSPIEPVLAAAALEGASAMDEDLAPVDDDAPLKRSRKATAKRVTAPAAALAVDGSMRAFAKPPKKGVERAKVGYRRVRISSEPDATRSQELGRLDRGDEVEIIESHEGFLRIRTPDDITGWILRHTIVGAPSG